MSIGAWNEPVGVFIGKRGTIPALVNDALNAVEILIHGWPEKALMTRKHLAAQQMCILCLMGKCHAEEARKAFAEAAKEAGAMMRNF